MTLCESPFISKKQGGNAEENEFRVIPGYEQYSVSEHGIVISIPRNQILSQYLLNDYLIVDTFRGSATETLPVHRAVALAWVENANPYEYTIVNHLDGDTLNNWSKNLEWTDYSGNNYHAVNTGLRSDNIRCKVRDFDTKEVLEFASMIQAAQHMGLQTAVSMDVLRPKQFGKLIKGKYEFRFTNDPTPWFYESREKKMSPSRYMVTVTHEDGTTEEFYSNRKFLFAYKLYHAPFKYMPQLAKYAGTLYPNKVFNVRDSYSEERYRELRKTEKKVNASASKQSLLVTRFYSCH